MNELLEERLQKLQAAKKTRQERNQVALVERFVRNLELLESLEPHRVREGMLELAIEVLSGANRLSLYDFVTVEWLYETINYFNQNMFLHEFQEDLMKVFQYKVYPNTI